MLLGSYIWGGTTLKKTNIFLSYCWNDSNIADDIYNHFKGNQNIELHRDTIDIGTWNSIKEYMQSIKDMDYTILLISDTYLKSANCMYEVLEVMRDRNYKDKIFPAVIDSGIYKPITRAKYVKHWQDEFNELDNTLNEIKVQNLGKLNEDLKRCQDISSNIADFLDLVSDMNNPNIKDICIQIEQRLNIKGSFENKRMNDSNDLFAERINDGNDLFASLGIQSKKYNFEPTDLEVSQFLRESFAQITSLLSQLCQQYQSENAGIQVHIEQIDTRTVIYQFYKSGQLVKGLKLFLSSMFGGGRETIGMSDSTMSYGGGNSWNSMYDAEVVDGELKLYARMSLMNSQKAMTINEVVADIWGQYIQIYLER